MKTGFPLNKIALWLSVCAVAAASVACSDDDMGIKAYDGEEIQFAVTKSASWSHIASRGGELSSTRGGSVLPLVSGTDSLYLLASVSDAWPSDKVGSRSSVVSSSDDLEKIGVFATRIGVTDQPAYMNNVEATKSSNWTPKSEYLWPGDGQLHFNAYSPYVISGADEGILTVPRFDSDGGLTLEYKVPAQVEDQIDLMVAKACDASASPCKLEFDHALTAIRFVAGAQMSPCTVSKIEILGVATSGTLDLESGEWMSVSGTADYAVAPDVTLDAASGSKYVTPGAAITADDETFILMPQVLTDDAKIVLTVAINGNETSFDASLAGQTWTAGKMVTYRLSATAESSSLILSVLDGDGNEIEKLNAKYTGSRLGYTVRSYYTPDGSTMEPVEWKAELVDKDGNILTEMPDWITSFAASGSGETDCKMVTDMITPVFLALSDETRALRDATDINDASGYEYFNLANETGAPTVENTANCYLINAPGKYSLPLVYGNAVKDGATNSAAYVSTLSNSATMQKKALLTFVNHLGNGITDPYIYNNSGCVPDSARLLWEEKIGMMRNIHLSDDKKSLLFEVPDAFIRQGNATVAVIDKDGTVMWSWHLWVTSQKNNEGWQTLTDGSTQYNLFPLTLGRVYAGDRTHFKADSVTVRFTQINVPDGLQPLSVDLTVNLAEKTIDTKDYYGFYQWGRKDPMLSGSDMFYDQYHNEISSAQQQTMAFGTSHIDEICNSIKHPDYFMTSGGGTVSPYYVNLWSIDNATMTAHILPENVKTVYDPCPVGAKVPIGNVYAYLHNYTAQHDSSNNTVYVETPDGITVKFPMLGYRSRDGKDNPNPDMAGFWAAASMGSSRNRYFQVSKTSNLIAPQNGYSNWGFGVRPAKDD